MPPESAPPPPYSEQAPPQADGALGAGTSAIEESGVISEDDVLSTIEAGRASALGASLRHVAAQLQQLGDILNEVSLPTRPVAAAAVSDAHTQLKAGLAAIRRAKTAGEGSLADLGVPRNSHLETESDLVVRAAADETVADPDWASRALSHANIGLRRDFAASEATTLVIARTQRRPAMQHGIAVLGGHMLATARQSSTAANQIGASIRSDRRRRGPRLTIPRQPSSHPAAQSSKPYPSSRTAISASISATARSPTPHAAHRSLLYHGTRPAPPRT